MKPATVIVGLCVVIGVLAFLQFRSCKAGPSHVAEAQSQDSMILYITASVKLLQAKADSFIILRKDRIIDSLTPLINMARSAVNDNGRQIAGTIAAGKEARVLHDTATILSNCDSLVEQVQSGTALVAGYEYLTDSLLRLEKEEGRITDSITGIYQSTIRLLQAGLDSSNARYQNLYKDYGPLQNASHKRWGIGPGAGAALIGGQIKCTVTLSVHYDLFKF